MMTMPCSPARRAHSRLVCQHPRRTLDVQGPHAHDARGAQRAEHRVDGTLPDEPTVLYDADVRAHLGKLAQDIDIAIAQTET